MRFIALVVYACLVNNKDLGNRDFQVIEVIAHDTDEVADKIAKVKHKYKNDAGESVVWQLVDIFQFGRIRSRPQDMEELAGFIAKKDELFGKISLVRPKLNYLKEARRKMRQKLA